FDGSGPSLLESFAFYGRPTQSWRTSQGSLLEGWPAFSATWPGSGTTRNGSAFQRRPLVRRISAIASSSWPTPKGSAANYGRPRPNDRGDLQAAVTERFTTPTADDTGARKGKYSQGGSALSLQAGG